MKKISKSEIPVIIIYLIQIIALSTLSTLFGQVIAIISIILGPIIAVYFYKKNKVAKQRFVLLLILTSVLLMSLVLQLIGIYYYEMDLQRIIRIIRRVGVIILTSYVWMTNEK